MFEPLTLALLAVAGFGAGLVDSIAGGGGLLTVPALLATGMPPLAMLGTNKAQSSIGTTIAVWRYARAGLVDWRALRLPVLGSGLGAAIGCLLVQRLHTDTLKAIIPLLLMVAIAYFIFSPRMTDEDKHGHLSLRGYAPVAGLIGFYDGFFGPGTGSICAASLVGLTGMGLRRATAATKVINLTSNLVSFALFVWAGQVIWLAALVMGVANIAGAWIGSHLALKHGATIIRPLLILVSLALTVHVVLDPANPLRALFVR